METKEAVDTADKALDMLSSFATTISESIEKLAPEVWRIMIRQQFAEAVTSAILSAILLGISIATYKVSRAFWVKEESDGGWEALSAVSYALTLGLLIGVVSNGLNATKLFLNPEYYAIKDLLDMAK